MTSRPTVPEEVQHPHLSAFRRWRERVRRNPALRPFYKLGVFLLGLALVGVGLALAVLPGPLTIPPVLAGLWVWSTEFVWASRIFESFKAKAKKAWEQAKRKPVSSTLITVFGILGAVAAVLVVRHYDLIAQARAAVGL